MVLRPEKEAEARAVFEKWDLDFAVVGETIAEDRFIVRLGGEVKADLPLKALSGDRAGVRPALGRRRRRRRRSGRCRRSIRPRRCCALIGEPEPLRAGLGLVAVRPQVMADTVLPPGSDAGRGPGARHRQGDRLHLGRQPALLPGQPGARRHAGGGRGLPQPDAPPARGRWRRPTTSTSATPSGRRSWASSSAASGASRAACAALDMPIVSGNVSLYNETEGRAILPTPTIGGGRAARRRSTS